MPQTIDEYRNTWEQALATEELPEKYYICSTSCILRGSYLASAPGMSDAFYVFVDFGDAICFCRYWALNEEVGEYQRQKPSKAKLAAYQAEAEHYFDDLLERYVSEGYQPGMDGDLLIGIEEYFRVFRLGSIYVLPHDLDALLDATGNPLTSSDEDDSEEDDDDEDDESYKAKFDLEDGSHLNALYERLVEMIS